MTLFNTFLLSPFGIAFRASDKFFWISWKVETFTWILLVLLAPSPGYRYLEALDKPFFIWNGWMVAKLSFLRVDLILEKLQNISETCLSDNRIHKGLNWAITLGVKKEKDGPLSNETYFLVHAAHSWLVRAVTKAEFQKCFEQWLRHWNEFYYLPTDFFEWNSTYLKCKFWYVYLTISLITLWLYSAYLPYRLNTQTSQTAWFCEKE